MKRTYFQKGFLGGGSLTSGKMNSEAPRSLAIMTPRPYELGAMTELTLPMIQQRPQQSMSI
jgi:hypothetical protein